eukprot:TRINITY_DN2030_c0_g1_i2.p1 TRINITY_DN2030_c0_g1~~TRINITY_DN2030_c0_g1_i2.p1  ORF type:complete len:177 (-),score=26.32 TRINITY_DN2030_c0_g1_i2:50-580(-)
MAHQAASLHRQGVVDRIHFGSSSSSITILHSYYTILTFPFFSPSLCRCPADPIQVSIIMMKKVIVLLLAATLESQASRLDLKAVSSQQQSPPAASSSLADTMAEAQDAIAKLVAAHCLDARCDSAAAAAQAEAPSKKPRTWAGWLSFVVASFIFAARIAVSVLVPECELSATSRMS